MQEGNPPHQMTMSRRALLAGAGAGLALPTFVRAAEEADPWAFAAATVARVRPPVFPGRDFPITRYGARGEGRTRADAAIRAAIVACVEAGGGRVVVPAGDYLTGPIRLRSNVNLHLEEGAHLRFSTNPKDYPLVHTRWEGMELINSDGRRYLDGVSSLWCNVHGHRVPEIDAAVRRQLDRVAHTTMLGLASEPGGNCSRLWPAGRRWCSWRSGGVSGTGPQLGHRSAGVGARITKRPVRWA